MKRFTAFPFDLVLLNEYKNVISALKGAERLNVPTRCQNSQILIVAEPFTYLELKPAPLRSITLRRRT
nr:MAG TPA: hypothetical protein [Caudoviricetes sp.]